jgi:hypothetical protein
MEEALSDIEPVTLSEVLGLDSWNQPRNSDDLQNFIIRKHHELDMVGDETEQLS